MRTNKPPFRLNVRAFDYLKKLLIILKIKQISKQLEVTFCRF